MWEIVAITLIVVVVTTTYLLVYKWQNPRCNGKLPRGSMGFPVAGETAEFFTPHSSYDISPFIKKRIARYGPLFRTNIVGQNMIVSTDPEINYDIFQQEGKSFLLCYTESFMEISGKESFLGHHGIIHKYLKNLVLRLVNTENLKNDMLLELNEAIQTHLGSWATRGFVDVKQTSSNLLFEYFAKKLISYDESKASKKLKENYNAFVDGLVSFPLNIPGTAFYACLQGRKKAIKVIRDIFEARKESNNNSNRSHDYLDELIKETKKENAILNEKMTIDMVFLLLFAAYESTSTAIALAIKFISDHPQVLAELTREHEEIVKTRGKDENVTWKEYSSMIFTHMVINETVRLANIVPAVFRRAARDVEIKGYTIPKDWLVMVVSSAIHINPDHYEDPFAFNPWRWKGKKLHVGSKTFMAFGGGVRVCVGADFAKLQIAIVLHYLVLNYRWKIIKGGEIVRKPGVTFPNGLHIQISEKPEDKS